MRVKLSASNIAWGAERDDEVLRFMADHGFIGLEIAPTRLFPDDPYDKAGLAAEYAEKVKTEYGLGICSMQSIWYGMSEKIVASEESRRVLLEYTKKALCFAEKIGCGNLVFGCPRNRSFETEDDIPVLEEFLLRCAESAAEHGAVIALEANPPIYNTNYINRTEQAVELVRRISHPALKINLDFGTVIENAEGLDRIPEYCSVFSHVHISEPKLVQIRKRPEHSKLLRMLSEAAYDGFVSIEMGSQGNILDAIDYLSSIAEQCT